MAMIQCDVSLAGSDNLARFPTLPEVNHTSSINQVFMVIFYFLFLPFAVPSIMCCIQHIINEYLTELIHFMYLQPTESCLTYKDQNNFGLKRFKDGLSPSFLPPGKILFQILFWLVYTIISLIQFSLCHFAIEAELCLLCMTQHFIYTFMQFF